MKKIVFAAMGAVMLVAVSAAWAEDKADAEVRKSVQQLQTRASSRFCRPNATRRSVHWKNRMNSRRSRSPS
jgi:hypothetical protein